MELVKEHNTHKFSFDCKDLSVCINVELPQEDLKVAFEPYADPYGQYWDRIWRYEYHAKNGYNIEDVKSADIYLRELEYDTSKKIKHFDDLSECRNWLEEILS